MVINDDGDLSSGALASFILYSNSLSTNASSISHSISGIVTATGALERIFGLMEY